MLFGITNNTWNKTGCKTNYISREKIASFQEIMLLWYEKEGRDFPWRGSGVSIYNLVVSEILLQRTQAIVVALFYDDFFNKYTSWERLAQAREEEIGLLLKKIGLWRQRATNLKKLAKLVVEAGGVFSSKRNELEGLPGVGQYIANAILLFCHDEPQPLLDFNMARLLERFFGPRSRLDIRNDAYLQALSHLIVRCHKPREINWGILDLASTVCIIKNPRCPRCPLFYECGFPQSIYEI